MQRQPEKAPVSGAFFRYGPVLAALLLLGAAWTAYSPGLAGDFLFDDAPNLILNPSLHIDRLSFDELWQASLSGNAGPLKRPLSLLSFALNYYFAGNDPYAYKAVNLGIHLANGLLVMLLVLQLLRTPVLREMAGERGRRQAPWLALAVTAVWLLHPLHMSNVLYVIQRMNSLSALFVLLGLNAYLHGRSLELRGVTQWRWYLITLIAAALAMLAKENGALLLVYAFVIECFLFRFQEQGGGRSRPALLFFALFLLLPGLLVAGFLLTHPQWLEARYLGRPFTLGERLLTEARILWFHLYQFLVPDITRFGLFHDDSAISRGLLDPPVTLAALLGWGLALPSALLLCRRSPLLAFALFWYLGGHLLESTVLPLELIHEHRNYLPVLGPAVALVCGFWLARLPSIGPAVRATALAGFALVLASVTWLRADQWGDPVRMAIMEVRHHPGSGRAQHQLGRIYYQLYQAQLLAQPRLLELARRAFLESAARDPYRQKPLFAILLVDLLERGSYDREILESLISRLSSQPFQHGDVVDFKVLVDCRLSGRCPIEDAQIERLFRAVLSNPRTGSGARQALQARLGYFYAKAMGRLDLTERIFRQLVEEAPGDVQLRLNLVDLLLATGRVKEALAQLSLADQADRLGIWQKKIGHYRSLAGKALESGQG